MIHNPCKHFYIYVQQTILFQINKFFWLLFPSLALLSHIVLCLFQWHAFSVPELQNFLIILEKEEKERMRQVEQRYAAYREKLLQALCKVEGKPG